MTVQPHPTSHVSRITHDTSLITPHLSSIINLLSLITLLSAFALRVFRLGDANIWWDEGLAVWAVRQTFWETTRWTACDVHPPLYFWTLWPWTRLVGESEFAARFITVGVGMLTVALLVPLGRRFGGLSVGLLAATLLATSRFHVWWSQEMRMYALAGLMHVAALLALHIWWTTRTRRAWLVYVLTTTAGLYTIYLSALMLVVHNLWVMGMVMRDWRLKTKDQRLETKDQRLETGDQSPITNHQSLVFTLLPWFAAQVAILGLFLPWLWFAIGCMSSWSVAEPIHYPFVIQLQATLLTLGISTHVETVTPLVIALVGALSLGLVALWRSSAPKSNILLLLLILALPSLVIFALALPRGLFYNPRVEARYFLPFAPPVYILFAWGLVALWRWRWGLGLVTGLFIAASFVWSLPQYYQDRYLRDDLQGMVQVLRAYARPDDAVALVSGNRYPVFLYYYERGLPGDRPPIDQVPRYVPVLAADNVDRELRRVARDHHRVWLAWVNGPLQDPSELAPDWLRQRYKTILSYGFAHNGLTLFSLDGVPPSPLRDPLYPVAANANTGQHVYGYDLPTHEYRPGDIVRLGVYWEGPATPARVGLYTGSASLGHTTPAVSRPISLAAGPSRAHVELPILPFMPPGAYHFVVDVNGTWQTFGAVQVSHTQPPGQPDIPLDGRLGSSIVLRGLSLVDGQGKRVDRLRPGTTIYVDLFWENTGAVDQDYTVFVHLLGSAFNPATAGPVWAGHDSPPASGLYPTGWWGAGTRLQDRHPLELPADLPPGDYQLEIGLYDASGTRLPASGAQADPANRRILGPTIQKD